VGLLGLAAHNDDVVLAVAGGDVDLLRRDAPAAVFLQLGLALDLREVGAGLRLGEHHRAPLLAARHLGDGVLEADRRDLSVLTLLEAALLHRVEAQRLADAAVEAEVAHGADIGAAEQLHERRGHQLGTAKTADHGRVRQPHGAHLGEALHDGGHARRVDAVAVVVLGGVLVVELLPVRGDILAHPLAHLLEERLEVLDRLRRVLGAVDVLGGLTERLHGDVDQLRPVELRELELKVVVVLPVVRHVGLLIGAPGPLPGHRRLFP
jgi:hypothetical protein